MSLNNAHHDGGVLIFQGEMILLHAANVQISFSGSPELKFGEKTGNAYLTTHRLIFLGGKGSSEFKSFSFPFCVLSEVDVEQPVFGSNFLKGKVRAQPDGGWRGEAKFKMTFKNGGAIEFAMGMRRAMQIAKQMSGQNPAWSAPPPSYNQATVPGAYSEAPPGYYSTPGNMYGWMPPAYNFPAPEAGSIFINDAPPPYPGMTPSAPQQPQQNGFGAPGAPQQNGFGAPGAPQQNGHPQQQPFNGGYPQQQPFNGGYPQQQQFNGGHPQQQQYGGYPEAPQQQQFHGGYQQQPPPTGGYPQQAYGGYPQGPGAPGFMFAPQQHGYAFANGNQAFVPTTAPPPYDEASKKNN